MFSRREKFEPLRNAFQDVLKEEILQLPPDATQAIILGGCNGGWIGYAVSNVGQVFPPPTIEFLSEPLETLQQHDNQCGCGAGVTTIFKKVSRERQLDVTNFVNQCIAGLDQYLKQSKTDTFSDV